MKNIKLLVYSLVILLYSYPLMAKTHTFAHFTYSLDISKECEFNITYNYPLFKITFLPPIKYSPKNISLKNGIIKRIQVETDKNGETKSLSIFLKKPVQYMVSRKDSKLKILFLVVDNRDKTNYTKISLQNIKFTKDKNNTLYIKLKVSKKIAYKINTVTNKTLSIFFPTLIIPPQFIRYYDLSDFKTNIEGVMLKNSDKGAEMRIKFLKKSPLGIRFDSGHLIISLKGDLINLSSPSYTPSNKKSNPNISSFMSGKEGVILPGMQKEYTGAPISIDLQDAEVSHVLRLLADIGGYNLILDNSVKGTITLKLKKVPWDQVLDLVLMQKGLGMVKEGNILRIAPIKKIEQEQERIREAREREKTLEPLITQYLKVNYTTAKDMAEKLKSLLTKRGKINYDDRTNQLIVTDIKRNLKRVAAVLMRLDRPEKQVLIEARVVYVRESFVRGLGIKWGGGFQKTGTRYAAGIYGTTGTLTASTNFTPNGFVVNLPPTTTPTLGLGGFLSKISGSNLFTIDAQLALGESTGEVKTISTPRIITLNNHEAEVIQGTRIATQSEAPSGGTTTSYYDAALKLSVKPQITPDNHLILEIKVSDDAPAEGENISTKSVTTKLMVRDGETIVIGGVQKVRRENTSSSVPFFSKIPILGNLFKNKDTSKSKEELLIFIRPKIL